MHFVLIYLFFWLLSTLWFYSLIVVCRDLFILNLSCLEISQFLETFKFMSSIKFGNYSFSITSNIFFSAPFSVSGIVATNMLVFLLYLSFCLKALSEVWPGFQVSSDWSIARDSQVDINEYSLFALDVRNLKNNNKIKAQSEKICFAYMILFHIYIFPFY